MWNTDKKTKEDLDRIKQRLDSMERSFKEFQAKLLAPKPKQKFLTTDEAADYLEVSRNTLYRYMREGQVAYHHIGGKRKLALNDLEEFINRNHNGAMPSIL